MGLYSLAEKKAYTLTLPDPPIQSREVIGSSYGWIITADETSELHAVNPIAGDQIVLPSVTTIEQVKPIFDDAGAICSYEYSRHRAEHCYSSPIIVALVELWDYLYYKAFLSSDPSTGDYFVVLIHNPKCQLSFARAGDDKWTRLPPKTCYEDCLFQGGLLYACTSFGEIHVFGLGAAGAVPMKIVLDQVKPYASERVYIVQDQCGELLQIWRSEDSSLFGDDYEYHPVSEHEPSPLRMTNKIKVHKVDLTSQNLVDVNTLDKNVLFIGLNQSLCLCVKEYPQLKANHAYFTDDDELDIKFSKSNRRDIGKFDLAKKNNMEIVSPQLWSNSPAPMWLVPNPRRMSVPLHN